MKITIKFATGSWSRFISSMVVKSSALLLNLVAINGPAQTFWVIHNFTAQAGSSPRALVLSGTTLYGTTFSGGNANFGTIFRLASDGSDFAVLKHFMGSDGANPRSLVLSGTTLYGTTDAGGSSNCGTLFKLQTDGSGFTALKDFKGLDGAEPISALLVSGTTLYGTTFKGGISNRGTVFRINTDGTGFALLKEFTDSNYGGAGGNDGCLPHARCLGLSGTTLYGTTMYGGASGAGGVFKVNTDGSYFAVLMQGNENNGGIFIGSLLLSETSLYGTTGRGAGGQPCGGVFKLATDGSDYTVLKTFTGYDGVTPVSLVFSGAKLYGTTSAGGGFTDGVLFQLGAAGGGFTLLKQFDGTNGAGPESLVVSGTTLFGTATWGGSANCGVVFGLSIAPPTITNAPPSQTVERGDTIGWDASMIGSPTPICRWFFNGTNLLGCNTNCWLELTNIQFSQIGTYTIVVSNIFGATTSAPVMLNVIPRVSRRPVPGVKVTGESGIVLNVDYASALTPAPDWNLLGPVSLTSTSQFYFDVSEPLAPQRFYRVWQTGIPAVRPSLNLPYLVPAITLTGNIGDSLRVDYINAIGPTNAWVNLDTVTLTNATQLYFDVTALGQPRRLYRIVPAP